MAGSPTPYDQLGGHDGLVALVERFYTHMDTRPEVGALRALHDDDLTADKHKLAAFLSGWLGGPRLYWQRHTGPELHRRHQHLPVDRTMRDQWMLCMRAALADTVADDALRARLVKRFAAVADRVVNQPDPS